MRPDWKFANTAKQLINNSKIELVKEGVEAPMLPSAQQIIDRYVKDIHDKHTIITNLQVRLQSLTVVTQQLSAENAQLRQQLQVAVAQAQPRQSPAVQELPPPGRSPLPQPDGSTTAQSQQRPPQSQAQAGTSKARVAGASPPGRSPLPESGSSAKARSQQRPPQPQAQAGSSKTRVAGASASPPSQSRRTTDTRFSPPTAGARTYTLRQGESLFGVANRNGCTVDQIIALNPGLSRSRVQPGQTIRLPGR
jgi:LysM repeat protein